MRFAHSIYLYGIPFTLLIGFLIYLDYRRSWKTLSHWAHFKLWSSIIPDFSAAHAVRKLVLFFAGIVFLFAALARPQWGFHEESVHVSGMDILFVLDLSTSMDVEDIVPTRLKKAKRIIKNIANQLRGDRIGLVGFAGSAYLATPLTTDTDYVLEILEDLSSQTIQNQGTAIAKGLKVAVDALTRGAENPTIGGSNGAKATSPTDSDSVHSSAVILVSDGEDHEEEAFNIAKKLGENDIRFLSIGIGTEKGGPVPIRDETGQLQGYKKIKSEPVISQFHEGALKQLAKSAGGRYFTATDFETEVEDIVKDLNGLKRKELEERKVIVYHERFQIFLALSLICLLIEMLLNQTKTLRTAARLLVFFLLGSNAHAELLQNPKVYLENNQGVDAFEAGKIDDSHKKFESALSRDPKSSELTFNLGTVQSKEGKSTDAISNFEQSATQAQKEGKSDLSAKSFYNLGVAAANKARGNQPLPGQEPQPSGQPPTGTQDPNAPSTGTAPPPPLTQQTEPTEPEEPLDEKTKDELNKKAIESYIKAIQEAQKSKDGDTESKARKNLELLSQHIEQQKQQQKQQKQEGKDDKKEDKDQQSQKDQKDGEGKDGKDKQDQKEADNKKDGKDGQQKKYQDPSEARKKQKFESKNLKKEDAERVLNEIGNDEKQLRARLSKNKGRAEKNEKDW